MNGGTVALSGNDTTIINDRVLNDLIDGDTVSLSYPNNTAAAKTGKNGNTIYSNNESGEQCEVTIRVVRGSSDDRYLNGLQSSQRSNFAGFSLMNGEFIKKIGNGQGKVTSDTHILSGGVFTKYVPAKSNAEGDTEQSVAVYVILFGKAPRVIG